MNKARRKELTDIYHGIAELMERLEIVLDEEQECLDNIPENLQGSERYERAENAVSSLESAFDSLSEAFDYIDAAQE